jgi:hypothetical protein
MRFFQRERETFCWTTTTNNATLSACGASVASIKCSDSNDTVPGTATIVSLKEQQQQQQQQQQFQRQLRVRQPVPQSGTHEVWNAKPAQAHAQAQGHAHAQTSRKTTSTNNTNNNNNNIGCTQRKRLLVTGAA